MLQQQIAHVKQTIGTIQQDLAVIIKEVDRRNGSREARNRVEIPRMAEASVPTSGADLRAISNTFGQMFGGIFKPGGRREDGSNAADNQSETVVAANNNRVSSRFENVPDNDILAEYKRRLEQLATIETV